MTRLKETHSSSEYPRRDVSPTAPPVDWQGVKCPENMERESSEGELNHRRPSIREHHTHSAQQKADLSSQIPNMIIRIELKNSYEKLGFDNPFQYFVDYPSDRRRDSLRTSQDEPGTLSHPDPIRRLSKLVHTVVKESAAALSLLQQNIFSCIERIGIRGVDPQRPADPFEAARAAMIDLPEPRTEYGKFVKELRTPPKAITSDARGPEEALELLGLKGLAEEVAQRGTREVLSELETKLVRVKGDFHRLMKEENDPRARGSDWVGKDPYSIRKVLDLAVEVFEVEQSVAVLEFLDVLQETGTAVRASDLSAIMCYVKNGSLLRGFSKEQISSATEALAQGKDFELKFESGKDLLMIPIISSEEIEGIKFSLSRNRDHFDSVRTITADSALPEVLRKTPGIVTVDNRAAYGACFRLELSGAPWSERLWTVKPQVGAMFSNPLDRFGAGSHMWKVISRLHNSHRDYMVTEGELKGGIVMQAALQRGLSPTELVAFNEQTFVGFGRAFDHSATN